ncbi:O-antigen ligase domain-containing protein [Pseudomonas sp. JDS28PS106]|uniref:O-antigen ligase family protein n=1 Tax=Pseudomonas sp. JDS28PS106 TaxID=2497235 RepID=UPI002FD54471
MSIERTGFLSNKVQMYFGAALIVFLLSYILNSSAKSTNNLYYVLIALPGLFFLFKHRAAGVLKQPLGVAWAVFMAWFLVPATIAGDFQFYKHILYVSIFVLVVGGLVDNAFFRGAAFIRAQFWTVCLYILSVSIYYWLTGRYEFGQRVELLPARMENVIYSSGWLVCCLALALPAWAHERRWFEAACATVLTLVVAAFVLQTRTALVGAAFLFAVCALYSLRRAPGRSMIVLTVLALVAGLAFWLVKDEQWIHLLLVRGDSFRIDLFRIMTGEWRNCGWLLGCGIDFHTSQTLPGGIPIPHPHSIFVSLGVYMGAVALVLFIVLMAATLWNAVRMREGWGLYLACALVMLNFDGAKLIGNPDELWVLVLLPAAMVLGRVVQDRRARAL